MSEHTPDAEPEPESPGGARPRILVAEDEVGTLSLMSSVLVYAGFTVIAARDGREALLRARESPPDLALLDVMMPGMDGREVCRRMAADPALAHVPVILHSSAAERDVDWRACGADAFLAKPFSTRTLPDLVRRHLSTREASDRPRPRRLTDDEVREIARQIWQAVRRPPDPNPRDGVLSTFRELSPEDEARVEAAVVLLLGGVPAGDEPSSGRSGGTRPSHDGRGDDVDEA